MDIKDRTIALLIDSDNMSREYYAVLLDELSRFGRVTYRRLYGDFSRPRHNGWQAALLEHSIEQRQQSNYTKGKNATDSNMIIDAMDILYRGKVDCFCLATSDSDFTGLAMRFRNDNLIVIGAGEKKTPNSFRRACDRFIAVDELLQVVENDIDSSDSDKKNKKQVSLPKKLGNKKYDKKNKTAYIASKKVNPKMSNQDIEQIYSEQVFDDSIELEQKIYVNQVDSLDFPVVMKVDTLESQIAIVESNTTKKQDIIDYAVNLLQERANEDGWMHFSSFVDGIYRKFNDFNPKIYGQKNSHAATFFKSQIQDDKPIFAFKNIDNIVLISQSS